MGSKWGAGGTLLSAQVLCNLLYKEQNSLKPGVATTLPEDNHGPLRSWGYKCQTDAGTALGLHGLWSTLNTHTETDFIPQ